MPWVRFTADFDYTPPNRRGVTYEYLSGQARRVTRECKRQAVDDRGVAEVIPTPATRAEANRVRLGLDANPVREEAGDGLDAASEG